MDAITCRLLPYGVADGPHNMAADEALLEAAIAGLASVRFYGWSEATLSLGYFQPERLRHTDTQLAALPYIRRPSGGAALVHHHELTYAVALPAGQPWQDKKTAATAWLCRMQRIVAAALHSLGVATHARVGQDRGDASGLLCFQLFAPGDLMIGPAKVLGSAQRRQRGALLQHGAILLAASPQARMLPGIQELAQKRLPPSTISDALRQQLIRESGWKFQDADWTPAERQRIAELIATKYTQSAWNCKR